MTSDLATEFPIAESHSAEAVNAQAIAAEAIEKARKAQMEELLAASEARMTDALATALRTVFGENEDAGRFVDVSRVPLLCKSVVDINIKLAGIEKKLDEGYVTKQEFGPVRYLVYGAVLLILIGFFGALIVHNIPGAQVNVP